MEERPIYRCLVLLAQAGANPVAEVVLRLPMTKTYLTYHASLFLAISGSGGFSAGATSSCLDRFAQQEDGNVPRQNPSIDWQLLTRSLFQF